MEDGKEKRFRLRFLIKECGKAIFKHKVEDTLEEKLLDPDNKQKLICLNEKHVLTQEQFNLLNLGSGSPSVTDFDFTLWLVLLRTFFCSKSYNDPVWYKSNQPKDSLEAEIVGIRDCKNEIEDYADETLTEKNFENCWDVLSQIFLRVGKDINGLENMIDNVKTMDYDLAKDEEVMKDFKTWTTMEEKFVPDLDLSVCESKIYRLKLYALLVDFGTSVFRHVLDDRKSPAELCEILREMKDDQKKSKYQTKFLFKKGPLPSSKDLDVTVLNVVLQEIFKRNERTNDQHIANDIHLIKKHRNDTCHLLHTGGLTENEFKEKWHEISQAFLRLDASCKEKIPNLKCEIDKLMSEPIDSKREKDLQRIIEEWLEMDKTLEKTVINTVRDYSSSGTAIGRSTVMVRDMLPEQYFVKTEQYEKARQKLKDNYIIVLHGAPGEGKTTLAMTLLLDVSKNERYMILDTHTDWANVNLNEVVAIMIDDMFGSGIFDKKEQRQWQKHIPSIAAAINSKQLYVIITSRSYILNEAVQKMHIQGFFKEENIFTLSSKNLLQNEKQKILENHFEKACKRNEKLKAKVSSPKHKQLISEISRLEHENPTALSADSSTIGFPECARLFANKNDLYDKESDFFKSPMMSVKECISNLLKGHDDIFVAFFALWAQSSRTLNSLELELPVNDTSTKIIDPIVRLQFYPKDHIRKIRYILLQHRGGFIHFDDTQEEISFSHRVVHDAVGLVAYEINTTATIQFCDATFIENYVRIRTQKSDGKKGVQNKQVTIGDEKGEEINLVCTESPVMPHSSIHLTQARYGQLSLRMGELAIHSNADTSTHASSAESQYLDSSIFLCKLFEDDDFCEEFFNIMEKNNMLQKILMMPVRTLDMVFKKFKFLKMKNSEIRLPSFLVWMGKTNCRLTKECFKALNLLDSKDRDDELSMAMLISTITGDEALIEYLLQEGGKINIKMMSMALYKGNQDLFEKFLSICGKDDLSFLHEICQLGYEEIVSKLIEMRVNFDVFKPDKAGIYPIYHAICGGHSKTVKVLLEHDKTQAEKLSLFHIAVKHQQAKIIDLLLDKGLSPTKCDAEGRTPFLFAIYNNATNIIKKMLGLAIEDRVQSKPDKDNNTPLYVAVVKSVDRPEDQKLLKQVVKKLCQFDNNLHLENHMGETPLKFACKKKLVDIVNEIMKHGDPYKSEGSSILHQFVLAQDLISIQTLLKSTVDPNIHDKENMTPLMLAIETRNFDIVKELLSDRRLSTTYRK